MCDHNHSNSDGHGHGEGCSHEAVDQQPLVFDYNMHQYILIDQVNTLNEARDGDGRLVFKSMQEKNDRTKFVESDADAELLFNIPFSAHVRLSGLCISGEQDSTHPARIKLYKDRPTMSFDDVGAEPEQVIDIKQDPAGEVDYPLKTAKFNNVSHLSIFVERNFGADETKVYYIGLRGEYQQDILRGKVPITSYELNPNVADHKGEIPDATSYFLNANNLIEKKFDGQESLDPDDDDLRKLQQMAGDQQVTSGCYLDRELGDQDEIVCICSTNWCNTEDLRKHVKHFGFNIPQIGEGAQPSRLSPGQVQQPGLYNQPTQNVGYALAPNQTQQGDIPQSRMEKSNSIKTGILSVFIITLVFFIFA